MLTSMKNAPERSFPLTTIVLLVGIEYLAPRVGFGSQASETQKSPASQEASSAATPVPGETKASVTRGVSISSEQQKSALAVEDLLKSSAEYDGKTLVLKGRVQQVCAKKGCWFTLSPVNAPSEKSSHVRITSKGYLFFVPKDVAGYEAIAQGTVRVKTLSKAEVEHFTEDARQAGGQETSFVTQADGTALEIQFEAEGVELKPRT